MGYGAEHREPDRDVASGRPVGFEAEDDNDTGSAMELSISYTIRKYMYFG
jgi:hypothetical protein